MNNPKAFYSEKLNKYNVELKLAFAKLKRFTWYRLISFAVIFIPVSVLGFQWLTLPLTVAMVVLFFLLVRTNIGLEKEKQRLSVLKKLVQDEILALKHSFLHFQNGEQFLDSDHFFSYDLDLFGEGSLFQFLNRTTTVGGRQKLASWLLNPLKDKNEIESRQGAIRELSGIPAWRLKFLAVGKLFEETEVLNNEMKSWAGMELTLTNPDWIKWLIRIVPLVTVLVIIPAVLGISNSYLVVMVFLQFLLMSFFWQQINHFFGFFGRKSELLAKYMNLLEIIEDYKFNSGYLSELQKKIENPSASTIFNQLKSLVNEFEYRQNVLVGVVLNGLFTWDIRCVYKLWDWHQKHHLELGTWIDAIAEMDALISLGNYGYNHDTYTMPEISETGFIFEAVGLGHPLLEPKKRVCNNLEINGWSKVMIVTGANMAGKSTFLRTVGVNFILARLGAPVCATKLRITPIDIYTNMRTTDSLLKDESYFFAELKRLKVVLDRLQSGERIFVILDEMLKGTNSIDKLNGSIELIKKLVEFHSVSLIATHDLKLSEMEVVYPLQLFNKCFEIRIEKDELIFDYKLSEGATRTMNATFLMKKMGII